MGWGVTVDVTGVSSGGDGMFWKQMEAVVAQHCEWTQWPWIVHFKMVNVTLGEFCHNFRK